MAPINYVTKIHRYSDDELSQSIHGNFHRFIHSASQLKEENVEIIATKLSELLLQLAVLACDRLRRRWRLLRPGKDSSYESEMSCYHCKAILFEPTTLGDGITVCKPCVSKLPSCPSHGRQLGFGTCVNVVLSTIASAVAPDACEAASERHESNCFFRSKNVELFEMCFYRVGVFCIINCYC